MPNGGIVVQPARGDGLDGGDRAALRVPYVEADPARFVAKGGAAVDEAAELRQRAEAGLARGATRWARAWPLLKESRDTWPSS